MDLLATFYPDAENEVIPALKEQLLNGKTSEIRSQAAFTLMFWVASPASLAAVDEALPLLDDKTRDEVQSLEQLPGWKLKNRFDPSAKRTQEDNLAWLKMRQEKSSGVFAKRAEKLCKKLLRYELDVYELLNEPHPVADISPRGVGYRIDVCPKRETSASVSIWIGSNAIRCAIGPRSASLTMEYATVVGRMSATMHVRSTVEKVRRGKIKELISPDGVDSLMLVDMTFGAVEQFKSSSTVPDEHDVPDDWVPKSYEPY